MTKILCKNNEAAAMCLDLYTSGQVGAEISFEFSEEWDGLSKTVVFSAGDVQRDVLMQDGENTITIPWEVLQNAGEILIVGVYGIRGSELVIPTIYCRLGRVQRGADPSGDPGIPPTPSILDQAIAAAAAALASAQEAAAKAAAALQSATSAEDAADAAQAAASAATQAAAAAALALQTAQDAAASAGESANMASAASEAAALAKAAAELAQTAAESAKTAAQTAATNAGQSATTASEKAAQAAENAAASAAAASAAAASAASAAESAASAAESEAAVKTMVDRMGNVPVVSGTEFEADAETVIHKSTRVNIKTGVTDTEEAPLPVANTQQAGVMTAETVQAIMDLTAAVSTLSGQSVRLSYIDGASPTAAEIQAFVISKGYTDQTRWEYIAVVVKADKHVWRYYTGTGWQDDGIDTVSVATEYILGVVLGSSADGKVYVEADGTMSVNGYDAIISALENLSTGKADDNSVYHEWRLGYNATAQAVTKDGTAVSFSDVYAAVEDKTKYVYVEWSNRLYVPQYVSGGLIYFMCAYIDSGLIKLERIMFDASTGKALTGSLSTYDKNKIDELLRAKANASEVYTKTEIDEKETELKETITGKQDTADRVDTISDDSTKYPSAKAVWDYIVCGDNKYARYTPADLNGILATGFYSANGANRPTGTGAGSLIFIGTDARYGYGHQMFLNSQGDGLWTRFKLSYWRPWRKVQYERYIKTAMDSVAIINTDYFLGAQSAVNITLPSTGLTAGAMITVVFYSGATAATLSVSGTMLDFDYVPSANSRSEINALWDGTYWTLLANEQAVTA